MKVIFATALVLPLAVWAQTPPPGPGPGPGAAPGNSASALGFSDTTNGPAQVQERLQLTDTQMPYWADYVAKLDAYAKLYLEEKPAAAYASESAVRQFAHFTLNQQNRLAVLEDIESAAKRLYGVLNAAQRTIADQMLLGTVPVMGGLSNVPTDSTTRVKREPPARHSGGGAGGPGAGMGSF